jgi:hypothetical protein
MDLGVVDLAAMVAGNGDGGVDVGPLRYVGRLEAEQHQRGGAVQPGAPGGLGRIEDAQVGRPQLGLGDGAHGLPPGLPRPEVHPGGGAMRRAALEAQPRLRHDPQRALAAEHQPVGARAGAAARHAA